MKYFGISSLLAGSLLLIFLDLIPIQEKSSCKDKHKDQPIRRTLVPIKPVNPEPIKYIRETVFQPKIATTEVTGRGDTWVELKAKFDIDDPETLSFIKGYGLKSYGFMYSQNTEKESDQDFNYASASKINDDYSFSVKISNLNPNVSYVHCTFVEVVSKAEEPRLFTFRGENKILEKYNK